MVSNDGNLTSALFKNIGDKLKKPSTVAIPDFPKLTRGTDDQLYLQFHTSYELELFLIGLGIDPYAVPVYNCGGLENALHIQERPVS